MNNVFHILRRSKICFLLNSQVSTWQYTSKICSISPFNEIKYKPIRLFSLNTISHQTEVEERHAKTEKKLQLLIAKDPTKNRRNPIPVEVSIRYLKSKAYKECYGDTPVWKLYRRNFKGAFPPKTRRTCIRAGVVTTGNPCPICRDEYLIVHYTNIDLLKQFISPINGKILDSMESQVCQNQHKNLLVAHIKARNLGLITFDVPFREYDYSEFIE